MKKQFRSLEPGFQHPPSTEMGRTIGLKLVNVYSSLGQHTKLLEVIEKLLDRYGDRALQTMTRLVDVAPESVRKRMAFAEAARGRKAVRPGNH